MFQVAGSEETIEVIRLIASGTDIRNVTYHQELKLLQDTTPILASLLLKLSFSEAIPDDVCTLICQLCDLALAPFQPRSQTFPPPPANSELTYFPNLPMVRGVPAYSADMASHRQKQEEQDACRKYSSNHPTLTPGIFTIYCPHGVCCGFEVMKTHESPKHPFEIFLTRFESPPKIIIYDNSCKLHQYILNREPTHFKDTLFFVDRFHWRGHIGCSSGYSLDKYCTYDISSINSQVNEQGNAGLQRIKGQIAYMKPSNFMFHVKLFLGVTNMDKRAKIDMSN